VRFAQRGRKSALRCDLVAVQVLPKHLILASGQVPTNLQSLDAGAQKATKPGVILVERRLKERLGRTQKRGIDLDGSRQSLQILNDRLLLCGKPLAGSDLIVEAAEDAPSRPTRDGLDASPNLYGVLSLGLSPKTVVEISVLLVGGGQSVDADGPVDLPTRRAIEAGLPEILAVEAAVVVATLELHVTGSVSLGYRLIFTPNRSADVEGHIVGYRDAVDALLVGNALKNRALLEQPVLKLVALDLNVCSGHTPYTGEAQILHKGR